MCPHYDPTATDSPHIGGIQPTWGDLPHACEIIYSYYRFPDRPAEEIKETLKARGKKTKVKQQHRFLDVLGILEPDEGLLPVGIWLGEHFEAADQSTLSSEIRLGVKSELSTEEQGVWQSTLFEQDWLPMLATVNQLATSNTAATERKSRGEAFQKRVEHLDNYQPVNSINSWLKKVQAHIEWLHHLDYASKNSDESIVLTSRGQALHQELRPQYHPEWPQQAPDE